MLNEDFNAFISERCNYVWQNIKDRVNIIEYQETKQKYIDKIPSEYTYACNLLECEKQNEIYLQGIKDLIKILISEQQKMNVADKDTLYINQKFFLRAYNRLFLIAPYMSEYSDNSVAHGLNKKK